MITKALCKSFQQLGITVNRTVLARRCSTQTQNVARNGSAYFVYKSQGEKDTSIYQPNFRLTAIRSAIVDLNLPRNPASIGRIHQFPIDENAVIGEPVQIIHSKEDSVTEKSLELPSNENIIEKRAERMIVIRRRKMRKHKLKKLRKRMKFVWGKRKQKREMKKEKAFHAELLGKIRAAEKFDPKAEIAQLFEKLDKVRLPNKYRGVEMPESQIREFLQKDTEKYLKKINKPRLKL